MKFRRSLLLIFLLGCFKGYSQNLVKLEYFFDVDPGYGLGEDVLITPATSLTDFTFNVPVTGLSDGFHTLSIRTRDEGGVWSMTEQSTIYKVVSSSAESIPDIVKLEYFFDADPGYGLGEDVLITPATSLTDFTFNVPVTGLSDGFHTLSIRTRDESGVWSMTEQSTIYKVASSNAESIPNIVKLEYFFDADPGYGLGVDVPITAGISLSDFVFSVPVTSLNNGFHTLSIRAHDENGVWSMTEQSTIYKVADPVSSEPLPDITYLEYFIDTDPGYGMGTIIPISPDSLITDIPLILDVSGLTEETHVLNIRALDANGIWSMVASELFEVCDVEVPVLGEPSDITTSSFTASWNSISGATSYLLDVSRDTFLTYESGYEAKELFINTASVTGLDEGISYQFRVRSVVGCNSLYSNVVKVDVPLSPPTSQPSNLVFQNPGNVGFQVTFSAASDNPAGYLAIRGEGLAPEFVPMENTNYTAGESVGDSEVAFKGPGLGFVETSLNSNAEYYYKIFAYNSEGDLYAFNTTNPLSGSFYTTAHEPINPPTNLAFANVTNQTATLSFDSSVPDSDSYLIVRSIDKYTSFAPEDGVDYTVGNTYEDGFIVSSAISLSLDETGLTELTEYYYTIFAYNGSNERSNYLTGSSLQGFFQTALSIPENQPSNFGVLNQTSSSFSITFDASTSNPSGYFTQRKLGSNPTTDPEENVFYEIGDELTDGSEVIGIGSAINYLETELQSGSTYYYRIFAYNETGSNISYLTTNPLTGEGNTLVGEPTVQPANLTFEEISKNSALVSFTPPDPEPAGGHIVFRSSAVPSNVTPEDGTNYPSGVYLDNDIYISYIGIDNSFTDTGMGAGIEYHYSIFTFNGSGGNTNYLTTLEETNRGSFITLPEAPNTLSTTLVSQSGFTVNWEPVLGATDYYLDISTDDFATLLENYNDFQVSGNSQSIVGLAQGVAYQCRVRSTNESGSSVNSQTIEQITIPTDPVLGTISNVGQTGFNLAWTSVTGATNYFVDVSDDDFVSLLTNYDQLEVASNSISIVGLTAGKTYDVRIRSANEAGISNNSNALSQILVPGTPTPLDATNTTSTSFKAKWESVEGADSYYLDVSLADNNFSPSLPDYTNLEIIGSIESLITRLQSNTAYQYRVSASNSAGDSPKSISVSVNTFESGSGNNLQLNALSYDDEFSVGAEVSLAIQAGLAPYDVIFYHKGISESAFTPSVPNVISSSEFSFSISDQILDELGVAFYFEVSDANGQSRQSEKGYIYRVIPTAGFKIPFTSFGGTLENYNLFSIPYDLDDNLIATIFDELGSYDITKWRLMRYQGGRNVDFGSGISRIELGKSYWFNSKEPVDLKFNSGKVAPVTQDDLFEMRLEPGWNQIGNPYVFSIFWEEILDANDSPNEIGKLKIYNSQTVQIVDGNTIPAWSGGFVHNDSQSTIILEIPISYTTNGRQIEKHNRVTGHNLDDPEWLFEITAFQGGKVYNQAAIGMHPEANLSKDWYDDIHPPSWGNNLEFYTKHSEFFSPRFAQDIVPSQMAFTWDFILKPKNREPVTLKWDKSLFTGKKAKLFLLESETGTLLDMTIMDHYQVAGSGEKNISFMYTQNTLIAEQALVLNPYPNPVLDILNMDIILPDLENEVSIILYTISGASLGELYHGYLPKGLNQIVWNKDGEQSNFNSGIYLMKYIINSDETIKRIILE